MAQLAFSQRLHAAYTHTSAGRVHLSREPWDGAAGIQIAGALGGSPIEPRAVGLMAFSISHSRPVRGLPLLFLWASEGDVPGDVRRFGRPRLAP